MISKEEYVLHRVNLIVQHYLKEDKMINPITLNELIQQWSFDYDVEKEYRPEVLKKNGGAKKWE